MYLSIYIYIYIGNFLKVCICSFFLSVQCYRYIMALMQKTKNTKKYNIYIYIYIYIYI